MKSSCKSINEKESCLLENTDWMDVYECFEVEEGTLGPLKKGTKVLIVKL